MRIILASKSGVRKDILDKYKVENEVIVSNVDEDEIKDSLLSEGANPLEISKNLAEIKSIKGLHACTQSACFLLGEHSSDFFLLHFSIQS